MLSAIRGSSKKIWCRNLKLPLNFNCYQISTLVCPEFQEFQSLTSNSDILINTVYINWLSGCRKNNFFTSCLLGIERSSCEGGGDYYDCMKGSLKPRSPASSINKYWPRRLIGCISLRFVLRPHNPFLQRMQTQSIGQNAPNQTPPAFLRRKDVHGGKIDPFF